MEAMSGVRGGPGSYPVSTACWQAVPVVGNGLALTFLG